MTSPPDPRQTLHRRAEETAQLWLVAARDARFWVSSDLRIGVDDGAKLVGMSSKGFAKRLPSTGILVYQVGGGRHKRSIKIYDLALWLESLATPADRAA